VSTHTDASVGDETPMVARVNYSREGAGDLVRYIEQGADRGLRDETGRRLSSEERDRFLARSEQRGFTRSVVLSVPDHAEADLSDRSMERETQRTMNETLRDAPSARYVYGLHEDTDHRHAHVRDHGQRARSDLGSGRSRSPSRTGERALYRTPREIEWEFQQAHEQAPDRDFGRG